MRKINIPNISQESICDSFKDLKYKEIVLESYKEYEEELKNPSKLYDKETERINNDEEYSGYMKKMYSERFANKSYENIYKYYSEIRASQKVCPYCNYFTREVKQLDHFLPKSKFPSLAITVKNLVPICKECNELKGDHFSRNILEQFINPYYGIDVNDILEFLKCEVIEQDNIGFKFYIIKLSKWDDITFNNVKFHFERLKLDELYLTDFQAEFDVLLEELKCFYREVKDKQMFFKLLECKVDAYRISKNRPWRYVGLNSLVNNNWFLSVYLNNVFNSCS